MLNGASSNVEEISSFVKRESAANPKLQAVIAATVLWAVAEVLEYVVKPVLDPEMRAEMRCKGKASCYEVEFTISYTHLVSGAATAFHLANTVTTFMLQFENGREINPYSPNHRVRIVRDHGLRTSLGRDANIPFTCW